MGGSEGEMDYVGTHSRWFWWSWLESLGERNDLKFCLRFGRSWPEKKVGCYGRAPVHT